MAINKHVAKPVLSDPFWNERVEVTAELTFAYQLNPVVDREAVLKLDRDKLAIMPQFQVKHDQSSEGYVLCKILWSGGGGKGIGSG